jgi:AraC-like DNA-binding protein
MYEFSLSHEQRKKMNWLVYEEISRYIEENYAWVTVRDLVSKFHFNEDYYNRILKEKLGMTYLEYVQDIRLKNARQLLVTTDMTVDEVADAVGYQNKGYFYKIFLEKYEVTPAKIRKSKEHFTNS